MIFLALALATLGPAPAGVEKVEVDCVRHEPVKVTPKHRPKTVKRVYRPRLFKKDPPSIIEEDCGEGVLPPVPSVALEPLYDIPLISLRSVDVPVFDVPPVEEEQPCDCFVPGGLVVPVVYVPGAGIPPLVVAIPPAIPPVPEPSTWALLMGSMLANRLWYRCKTLGVMTKLNRG